MVYIHSRSIIIRSGDFKITENTHTHTNIITIADERIEKKNDYSTTIGD
jgi:hypothetical protein